MFGGLEVATHLPRSPQEDPPEEAGTVEEVEEALVEAFWKTRLEVPQADDHDLGIYSNKGQRGTVDLHIYKESAYTAYKASERGLTNLEAMIKRCSAKLPAHLPSPQPKEYMNCKPCDYEFPERFFVILSFTLGQPPGYVEPSTNAQLWLDAIYSRLKSGTTERGPKPWPWQSSELSDWEALGMLDSLSELECCQLYEEVTIKDNPQWWQHLTYNMTPKDLFELHESALCAIMGLGPSEAEADARRKASQILELDSFSKRSQALLKLDQFCKAERKKLHNAATIAMYVDYMSAKLTVMLVRRIMKEQIANASPDAPPVSVDEHRTQQLLQLTKEKTLESLEDELCEALARKRQATKASQEIQERLAHRLNSTKANLDHLRKVDFAAEASLHATDESPRGGAEVNSTKAMPTMPETRTKYEMSMARRDEQIAMLDEQIADMEAQVKEASQKQCEPQGASTGMSQIELLMMRSKGKAPQNANFQVDK